MEWILMAILVANTKINTVYSNTGVKNIDTVTATFLSKEKCEDAGKKLVAMARLENINATYVCVKR